MVKGAAIGIASGSTAGILYAALTPGLAVGHGAAIGIVAGAVAGVLHALLQKHIR